jgi:hypothetical protein
MSKRMLRVVGELIGGSIQVAAAGYYLTPVPLSLSEHLKEVYWRERGLLSSTRRSIQRRTLAREQGSTTMLPRSD